VTTEPADAKAQPASSGGGSPVTYSEYRYLVLSDLYRIAGSTDRLELLEQLRRGESYAYVFWMRTCNYADSRPVLRRTLRPIARRALRRLTYRLGISIPAATQIGSGFYIGHFGGIVVSPRSVIGKNCNISQGVTVGQSNRGRNKGCPVLGDGVYIGPGAKIVGAVRVGNNVAIGANCVVTRDVSDDSVVVGVPGKVISRQGAAGYVNRTDYESKIR
jgi:serine O-acetyltransferase